MKFNTKKLLSVTSSLLIAAQQCFIAMPAAAVDAPSEAETYAQQIGLELNSGAAEDALSDLIDINDSDLAVSLGDNNKVRKINGLLSDETVNDSNDAKDIIAKTAELLGIDNVNREIRLCDVSESEYNRVYVFKQYYQGLEMVNSYIKVVVDKETGEAEFLNSSVVSDFSIDTTPAVTAQQAINAVVAKFGQTSCTSHKLAVYSEDNESFKLAWKIDTTLISVKTAYVDALNGEVLNDTDKSGDTPDNGHTIYSNSFLMNWNNKILPQNQTCFKIDIATNNNMSKLHDMKRNIYILRDPSFYYSSTHYPNDQDKTKTVTSYDPQFNGESNELAVAALYNVEKAYDFYNNHFGHKGWDKKNSDFFIIPDLKEGNDKHRMNNAYGGGNGLWFGEGDGTSQLGYATELDIVCHEFTHSVTGEIVKWGSNNGETGSLNEAYSDIMGEYCDSSREWQHGTDQYIANTNKNKATRKTKYNRDLTKEDYIPYTKARYKNIESHTGSSVISHVAYLMHYYGISDDVAMHIWYNSLDYLTSNASFEDCRDAVVNAAFKVVRNNTQDDVIRKIKTAFNRVRVCKSTEIMGDIDGDGGLTAFDLTMLKQIINGNRNYNGTKKAQADLNCDGKVDADDARQLQRFLLAEITEFTNKPL